MLPFRPLVKGKGKRGKVLISKTIRDSPNLGHQAMDPKENPVLMLPLSLIPKRSVASIAMTKGI